MRRLPYQALRSRHGTGITLDVPDDFGDFLTTMPLENGQTFSFAGRDYLQAICQDTSDNIAILKSRQVGLTTLIIGKIIHNALRYPRTTSIYCTDTYRHAVTFSQDRLDSILDAYGISRHVHDKKISRVKFPNGSLLHVISSYSRFRQARSLTADFVFLDECQETELEYLPNLLEAMSQSRYGKAWIIGTGYWEGSPWHKYYIKTTAQEWNGKSWMSHGAGMPGYHISQTMLPNITAQELDAKRVQYGPAAYTMEVLGEFTAGAKIPLPYSLVIRSYDEKLKPVTPSGMQHTLGKTYACIDWGGGGDSLTVLTIAQMIEGVWRILYLQKWDLSGVEELGQAVSDAIFEYKPDVVYADLGGNKGALQHLEKQGHTVKKVSLLERPQELISYAHYEDKDQITVDKSPFVQKVISWFETDKITIPLNPDTEWSVEHLTSETASTVTKNAGGTVLRFQHMPGRQDDFLMTLVFLSIAHHTETDPNAPGNYQFADGIF